MSDDGTGFRLLEISRIESGTGRKIYKFQCKTCKHIFLNHKNAKEHVAHCKKKDQKEPSKMGPLDDYFTTTVKSEEEEEREEDPPHHDFCEDFGYPVFVPPLMHLIAECNIPFSQLDNPVWKEFVKSLNESADLPCSQTIKAAFKNYANHISEQSLQDMHGTICGIAVDGTTYREKHYYITVLIGNKRIRLLRIKAIECEDAESLSQFLKEVYEKCVFYKITISGVCSDNGPGIKAALTKNHPLCFQALIGDTVFWLSCSVHTSQLAIGDFLKTDKELRIEIDKIVALVSWIDKRDKEFKEYCSCKLPHYIVTRWNTLVNVIEVYHGNHTK